MTTKDEMLSSLKASAKVAAAPITQIRAQATVAETAANEQQVGNDIQSNEIYKIVEGDPSKSIDQAIEELKAYILTQNGDYEESARRFAEFRVYFANRAEQSTERTIKRMEELKRELESEEKARFLEIAGDLNGLVKDMGLTDKLIKVTADAADKGTTLAQLKIEQEQNDAVQADLAVKREELVELESELATLKTDLETAESAVRLEETNLVNVNPFKRAFGGDKQIKIDLAAAKEDVAAIKTDIATAESEITAKKTEIAEKEKEYRTDLDSGSYAVLRTLEGTEDDIKKRIISSLDTSIALIRKDQKLLMQLIQRAASSEAESIKVTSDINRSRQIAIVLKGAVDAVSNETNAQTCEIQARLAEIDAELQGVTEGTTKHAVLDGKRLTINQTLNSSQHYERMLNDAIKKFDTLAAGYTEAEGIANQTAAFSLAMQKNLEMLNEVSLPNTANKLISQLNVQRARQTGAMSAVLSELNQHIDALSAEGMEQVIAATTAIHKQDMAILTSLTDRLQKSDAANVEYAKTIVVQGQETRAAQDGMTEASRSLLETLEALAAIRTELTGHKIEESTDDAGPGRPAGPKPVAPAANSGLAGGQSG